MKLFLKTLLFFRIHTAEKALFKGGAATFTVGEALHLINEKLSILLRLTGLISFVFYIILLDLEEVEKKWNDKKLRIRRLLGHRSDK